MTRTALALALLLLVGSGSASAQLYRWTDERGTLHFTSDLNQVPPAQRAAARHSAGAGSDRVQRYSSPTRDEPAAPRAASLGGVSGGEARIPFERQGKLMWVEATVNGSHRVPFLIDTGASGVSLPASVAERIGIRVRSDTPRVTVSTANGVIRVPLVEVDSIALGPARVERLEATVNPTMQVGLLGGSFFNNFRYEVDTASGTITLEPNEGVRAGEAAEQWQQRFRRLHGSIERLESYLASREITRESRRAELEENLATLKQELHSLEIEANHARVPHHWRR